MDGIKGNIFFDRAVNLAARLAGKPGRILGLLGQLSIRLYRLDKKNLRLATMYEKMLDVSRLLRAHTRGDYRIRSLKPLLALLAAIIYFINPVDLIPDFVPGIGLVDDFSVLMWVYTAAKEELDAFLTWEKNPI